MTPVLFLQIEADGCLAVAEKVMSAHWGGEVLAMLSCRIVCMALTSEEVGL